ncbi:MAG TPA: hypothetical protein VMQ62_14440 [Dongiaceae bacterium]|nr:hypothetical protein [Dongiaceae bacterium]
MKRMSLVLAAVAVVALGAVFPASAETTKEKTCSVAGGDGTLTYDCDFHVKHYTTGSPVTLSIGYACEGSCGSVVSFGLDEVPFTPAGVAGHMVSGRRLSSGLELTFVFDSLNKKAPGNGTGMAHFVMTMMMPDGTGGLMVVHCPIDVHLNDTGKSE